MNEYSLAKVQYKYLGVQRYNILCTPKTRQIWDAYIVCLFDKRKSTNKTACSSSSL